ncbi:energy transducer TonB [Pyxidicoccus xibeiensis]|uniref:energy transducer TonB n=1 Tax=Pyxidicoccus xibeiensis TaxID=2906759 RepID=UPI0020A750D3|nr:energy transducer TonB [Pyxidicoccus xibeiensis]MCP3143865.1 energy transducer TonB [Pyxidicoccus xibeiensis]
MRLLIALLVLPGIAYAQEERSAPADGGTVSKSSAETKQPAPPDDLLRSEGAQAFLERPPDPRDVLPFGAGMTRPERISGDLPQPTPEAFAEGAQGTALLKCTIWATGEVTRCLLLQPLGHLEMDVAIMKAVKKWRFKPATFRGHPVSVSYTFGYKVEEPPKQR